MSLDAETSLNKKPLEPHEIVSLGVAATKASIEIGDRDLLAISLGVTAFGLREMRGSTKYTPIDLAERGLLAGSLLRGIDPHTVPTETAARFTRQTALVLAAAGYRHKTNTGQ